MADVKITDYGTPKNIEKFVDAPKVALPVTLTGTAGDLVKAGTIIGGVGGSAVEDNTLKVEKANGTGAEGVLVNDTQLDGNGEAPASMYLFAFIDLNKLPEAPTVDAKTALKNKITFID